VLLWSVDVGAWSFVTTLSKTEMRRPDLNLSLDLPPAEADLFYPHPSAFICWKK
jgi:hypothetical protein